MLLEIKIFVRGFSLSHHLAALCYQRLLFVIGFYSLGVAADKCGGKVYEYETAGADNIHEWLASFFFLYRRLLWLLPALTGARLCREC